jgi:hypothetical protein
VVEKIIPQVKVPISETGLTINRHKQANLLGVSVICPDSTPERGEKQILRLRSGL